MVPYHRSCFNRWFIDINVSSRWWYRSSALPCTIPGHKALNLGHSCVRKGPSLISLFSLWRAPVKNNLANVKSVTIRILDYSNRGKKSESHMFSFQAMIWIPDTLSILKCQMAYYYLKTGNWGSVLAYLCIYSPVFKLTIQIPDTKMSSIQLNSNL